MATTTHQVPTVWTPRLQVLTFVCSAVFTLGTVLHGWVIINPDTLELMMTLSGKTPAEAAAEAPGFLAGFRAVGAVYVIGNTLGMLALRGWKWTFWVALLVNMTQAAGPLGMIPPVMWKASAEMYGVPGLLPSILTDGGALVLSIVLIVSLARFRSTWAHRRA
ncbi:hypothetical protein ACNF49_41045 [Actinomadura sp. ATCC 39365]